MGSIVCYLTGLSHVDPVSAEPLARALPQPARSRRCRTSTSTSPGTSARQLIVRVTSGTGGSTRRSSRAFATYRSRGAIRDIGKALGLPFAELERLARIDGRRNARRIREELERCRTPRRKLASPRWRAFADLCSEIAGLPRHISQHPGGMVISTRPLVELVPVQPCAMAGRQMVQWDKDSCADAGFLEDRPARARDARRRRGLRRPGRAHARRRRRPVADPARRPGGLRGHPGGRHRRRVPDRDARADAVLLRTRPENLDDLTVQVALVRPGPIQGKARASVHRASPAAAAGPSFVPPVDHPLLAEPLRDTLGVVVFQDQVLDVAIALAGFTRRRGGGASPRDERASAARRRSRRSARASSRARRGERSRRGNGARDLRQAGRLLRLRLSQVARGRVRRCSPTSRLAAHHYPEEFLCALLNEQPMGFYPPATPRARRAAARRRGASAGRQPLGGEGAGRGGAVRVGLEYVGVDRRRRRRRRSSRSGTATGRSGTSSSSRSGRRCRTRSSSARRQRRVRLLRMPRRALLWELGLVAALGERSRLGRRGAPARAAARPDVETPAPARADGVGADARRLPPDEPLGRRAPARRCCARTCPRACSRARELERAPHGPAGRASPGWRSRASARRPRTGVVFMLLEDELGHVNLIVPPQVYERSPRARARRAAAARARPLRAARPQPERPRRQARVARPARAAGRGDRRRRRAPAGRTTSGTASGDRGGRTVRIVARDDRSTYSASRTATPAALRPYLSRRS